jgi:hypothetical protein
VISEVHIPTAEEEAFFCLADYIAIGLHVVTHIYLIPLAQFTCVLHTVYEAIPRFRNTLKGASKDTVQFISL